jgi:hypothetical protein
MTDVDPQALLDKMYRTIDSKVLIPNGDLRDLAAALIEAREQYARLARHQVMTLDERDVARQEAARYREEAERLLEALTIVNRYGDELRASNWPGLAAIVEEAVAFSRSARAALSPAAALSTEDRCPTCDSWAASVHLQPSSWLNGGGMAECPDPWHRAALSTEDPNG